ncbi:MAG: histidine phosphatase family protein [Cyanothece sp. SIO1E1]|nr:histidine phosphatase family protein [Cyanothece sp. SIO1E1]
MNKALKPVELFLAVGLAATMTACGGTPTTDSGEAEVDAAVAEAVAQPSESGEGGESAYSGDTFEDKLSGAELLSALQAGGHVVFFRHAQTEKDYADQADPNLNVNDCSTQRALSESGWQDASLIGESFETLGITVGDVYSSQYCRAWQTAAIAFGKYEKLAELNFAPAEEYTDEQVTQMRAGIMPLLTAVPEAGTNTVVVGHDDVFESATGIYPEPQGVAFVLKPDGQGSFEILASLVPNEWASLQ